MSRFVDLSHPVVSGDPGYPGLPAPRIEPHLTHAASAAAYAGRASFEITRSFIVGHAGTTIDAPGHRHPGADDVATLGLERLAALPAIRLDGIAGPDRSIRLPRPLPPVAGAAVLVRTGWDLRRGTAAYWDRAPFLGGALAAELAAAGAALVGVDTWNIDDVDDPVRPAHTALLGAGIPVVEHLRGLERLPPLGARLFAVPPPIVGATSFPVRVFAELP